MIERHKKAHALLQTEQRTMKPLTKSVWFLIIAATAVLGFLAGTYSNQIYAAIAPVFGVKAYAGQLDLSTLQKTYQDLKANYDGTLSDQALIDGANHGLVSAAGDTYTLYMTAKEATAFNNDLSGNIGGGIGAEISMRSDKLTIIRTLPGNPAEKSGLNAGDVIVSVNDVSATGLTVDQVVSKIRGEAGTTVKLSVQRGAELKEFVITRAVISNPSVSSSVTNGLGTLTISRFDDKTAELARLAAQDFKKQGVKAIILDLRGNGGGYLAAAQEVAGLWLDNKVVVTERTNGATVDTLKSGSDAILAGIPTTVLINAGSASASEIVAGALQDHGVAKLVGEKSFGKGSVQELLPLSGGAQLKVTVARWYTPNGKNINQEGIKPDVAATLTQQNIDAGVDPQMDAAKQLLGL